MLISACILAARNLALWYGRQFPAVDACITNAIAIAIAKHIMAKIERLCPTA